MSTEERTAGLAYGSDATMFHAVHQGWGDVICHSPDYDAFQAVAATHLLALDSAIAKSSLNKREVVWSGHGHGGGSRGALRGPPSAFLGLYYQYPGYISTSLARETAIESFLVKRTFSGSLPTLLEFRLPADFPALDMSEVGHHGEFEILLGRSVEFRVIDASEFCHPKVRDTVLNLVLAPVLVPG